MPEQQYLRIKQQNCKHSKTVTDTILSDTDPQKWDVILLQEPYIYPETSLTISSAKWHPIYPVSPHPPKSVILISFKMNTNHFEQIQIPSKHITAISLHIDTAFIHLFNIYNPPETNDAIQSLHAWLTCHPPQATTSMIWAGDFNKHSPKWTAPEHIHRCRGSDTDLFLALITDQHMTLSLPPGTLTFESDQHSNCWSTLDLVFVSIHLRDRVTICDTCHEDRIPSTDHLPVHTTLDITVTTTTHTPARNFHNVDWPKFVETLKLQIETTLPNMEPSSPHELNEYVHNLTASIQTVIGQVIPHRKPSPHSKRWWTPELTNLRKEYARMDRKYFQGRDTIYSEDLRERRNNARNKYNSVLRNSKISHWKKWLEEINEQDIWKAGQYAKNPLANTGKTLIPTLSKRDENGTILTCYDTTETKSQAFSEIFFPPRPINLPPMPDDDKPFPAPLPFSVPKLHQVQQRIRSLKPFKAAGNDGIPNIVLIQASEIIAPCLHICLKASIRLKYFPKSWREWTTIVLRKPGRPDYTIPKAYRPIALYNTMGKVISGVMTDIATYLTIKHSLLPPCHFGGLPGRTTTDSLLYLTQKIKDAWRKKKVVSIIFLDIANAFPNAVTDRLLINMRKLGYPTQLIDFFKALLTDRHTRLSFDNYTSDLLPINNGIGQGEPASMLLYLIYNFQLISIPQGADQNGGGYVDDAFFMATGNSFEECDITLNKMLDQQEEWSRAHNSKAEISKFQCLRLTRNKNIPRHDFTCTNGQIIKCVKAAKLLGVLIDQELRWNQQVSTAVKKGIDLLQAVGRLTRPSFGLPYRYVRRLLISMVLPKVEYALPVWYTPIQHIQGNKRKTGSIGHTREITRVQRLGCKLLTGAFRCTATDVLELHAFIPPAELRLESSCYYATLRMASLSKPHPLFKIIKNGARRQPKRHPSPLHNLFRHFKDVRPQDIETMDPIRKHPSWKPQFTYHIAKNKEEAIKSIRLRKDDLQAYSDGSGYKGSIGSAAVIPTHGNTLQYKLGTEEDHTVFESEIIGVLLALQLADQFPDAKTMLIALDNQAVIRSLQKNIRQPGQYLLDEVHERIKKIKKRRALKIHMEWVPGHENVPGNELADEKAKEAAQGITSRDEHLPQLLRSKLPQSIAALRAKHKKTIQPRWFKLWRNSPRFSRLSKIDKRMPSSNTLKLLSNLSRRAASILTQLRTGHVALNVFLKKIKAITTPLCHTCRLPETVPHYLFYCRKYQLQRNMLKRRTGKAANSIRSLLGDPKIIHDTLRYITATQRFDDYLDLVVREE